MADKPWIRLVPFLYYATGADDQGAGHVEPSNATSVPSFVFPNAIVQMAAFALVPDWAVVSMSNEEIL
jgi:hypothetical protein